MMHSYYLHNSLGIVIIFLIGLIFSSRRKDISYKTLLRLFMSTVFTAVFILKTAIGKKVVNGAAGFFTSLYQASEKGIDFLFGSLSHLDGPWGFVFAIKVLPIIIFFSSFIAVLHYVGILKFIIIFSACMVILLIICR